MVVVADPAEVARLLAMKADELDASQPDLPMDLGRHSLLVLNGKQHLRDRKLMTPSLHGERLRGYSETMVDVADEAIARWLADDGPREGRAEMQWVTFQVILRCVFGLITRCRVIVYVRQCIPDRAMVWIVTEEPLRFFDGLWR